jgi:XRE family aerobic/anaerobic benzoate catabolism transcriptional regulator
MVLIRAEEGYTRQEIAERSGVSERFIAEMERGTANPSLLTLAAVAEALSTTVGDLVSAEKLLIPRLGRLLASRDDEEQERIADWFEEKLKGRERPRRVALLGLRGAGKTTVGQLLSRQLGSAFVELDRLVEAAAGHRLAQIFELHGEDYYRRLELEALTRVLSESKDVVIATGGGLVTNEPAYALLRSRCRTIWLRARPEEYLARVQRQGDQRPFQRHPQALADLKALLQSRESAYRRANQTVFTSSLTPERVAQRIAAWLERNGFHTPDGAHQKPWDRPPGRSS